jgi:hypothetical protein
MTVVARVMELDRAVRARVLEAVLTEHHPAVLVDSPPGAGKTLLVEYVASTAVLALEMQPVVVTARWEQTLDLTRRLRSAYPTLPVVVLHAHGREAPDDLASDAAIAWTTDPANVPHAPNVVVTTAAKLSDSILALPTHRFDVLIVDEAYQLAWREFAPFADLAPRRLLVGDPGQLRPLVRAQITRFEVAAIRVHHAAPRELLRLHPRLLHLSLPATRRLPPDTVGLVKPSFYPSLSFESMADPAERRVRFDARGSTSTGIDGALDAIESGSSLVMVTLPTRSVEIDEVDEEVAALGAAVVERLLERRARWDQERLEPSDIGYVDAHVASGAAVRRQMRMRGIGPDLMVNTPEIWQGLQRPIMVVKHPLSGVARLGEFPLEPGRLCVMASRHQLACVLVGRRGIGEALEGHHHDCAQRPAGADDAVWDGWVGNSRFWSGLEDGRLFDV